MFFKSVKHIFQEDDWDRHRLECGKTQKYLHNTAEYLLSTCKLPDKSVLKLVSNSDACETLQQPGKWPRTFSCEEEICPKCGAGLMPLTKKKQRNKTDSQLLITKLHVIVIDILSKKCKSCYIIRNPDTLQYGLLNIGDVTLVSLDIFFSIRNTVRSFILF